MAKLLAGHYYVLKDKKNKRYINEIMPTRDLDVPDILFQHYEDQTRISSGGAIPEERNVMVDVLSSTGADK